MYVIRENFPLGKLKKLRRKSKGNLKVRIVPNTTTSAKSPPQRETLVLDSKLVQARVVQRTREEQLEIGLDTAAPATNSPPTTLVQQELPVLRYRQSTADPKYELHSFHPDPNFQLLERIKSLPVPPETLYRRNKVQLGGYSSSYLASPGNGF